MIRSKRFAIERAADFIKELLSDTVTFTFFSSFSRFIITSLIGYCNFSVLCTCHVSIIFVNGYFFFLSGQSVEE